MSRTENYYVSITAHIHRNQWNAILASNHPDVPNGRQSMLVYPSARLKTLETILSDSSLFNEVENFMQLSFVDVIRFYRDINNPVISENGFEYVFHFEGDKCTMSLSKHKESPFWVGEVGYEGATPHESCEKVAVPDPLIEAIAGHPAQDVLTELRIRDDSTFLMMAGPDDQEAWMM